MRKVLVFIIAILISMPSFAGDVARKGTTGADQLLIPVGARGIATGGAFISNITGLEAIYFNPAGLDIDRKTEGMFSHMSYIADINVSYFAAGTSLGELGSIALSIKTLDFGQIPVTTFESPDGTGSTYSPGFLVAGLTYSKIVTDRVVFGVTAKVISESIMNASATGFALDFGVQYRFEKNISLGAAVKNIGSNMAYSGQDLEVKTTVPGGSVRGQSGNYQAVTEAFQIPSFFELAIAYDYSFDKENALMLGTTFVNNNSYEDQFKFGLEYSYNKMFFIRGGYNFLTENNTSNIYDFSFGAGLHYSLAEGIDVTFDYAFRNVKEFANPNHVFAIKLGLK